MGGSGSGTFSGNTLSYPDPSLIATFQVWNTSRFVFDGGGNVCRQPFDVNKDYPLKRN